MNNDHLLYRRGILQLVASGFFLSTSGIALRIIEQADGWQILFYRSLALSGTILLVLVFQKGSRFFNEFCGLGWNDCLLAVFLGTGFVAYVFALLYNTVANALFIFSCAPFVAGFFVCYSWANRWQSGHGLPFVLPWLVLQLWLAANWLLAIILVHCLPCGFQLPMLHR